MYVLCLVLVTVYAGQACHGILVYQETPNILDRARSGSSRIQQAGSGEYPGYRSLNVDTVKKSLRTTFKDKNLKHKFFSDSAGALYPSAAALHKPVASASVRTSTLAPDKRHTVMADSVSVPLGDIKPVDFPHRLLHHTTYDGGDKEGERGNWKYGKPSPFHKPTDVPGAMPCKKPRGVVESIATAPPNVCDLCPSENGMNPLDPCTCVGVGGSSAGMISISCPSSIVSLDQLRDIFHNTNFLTSHVYQFSLQGSKADGVLTRDIWDELDFKYVYINDNKITDVDNGAFIGSADVLIVLDLANNELRDYIAVYNDLPNLQYLNLRGNNISIIFEEDFKYPALTELDLSHNQITTIGWHSFAALKKLRSLNLSYNQLTRILDERFTFVDHDYSNVLVIDLSNNKISYLSERAFWGIRSVEIDFRFNQLHTLQEIIFSPIINASLYFAFFHFIGNEMICDCDLLWVVEDGNTLLCFDNFQCSNMEQTLYSLEVSDLGNCSQSLQYP